jgi:hypothetical protein
MHAENLEPQVRLGRRDAPRLIWLQCLPARSGVAAANPAADRSAADGDSTRATSSSLYSAFSRRSRATATTSSRNRRALRRDVFTRPWSDLSDSVHVRRLGLRARSVGGGRQYDLQNHRRRPRPAGREPAADRRHLFLELRILQIVSSANR